MTQKPDLHLGLIGDNIAASQSPRLHQLAGKQNSRVVQYDRLKPGDSGLPFHALLSGLEGKGYRGANVTYPYKENAARLVQIDDPLVQAIGAINTVVFHQNGARGYNTDYSGFISAYRRVRDDIPTGTVLMIGTGGVGRAIAFGLVSLGVANLRLVDRDRSKAEGLAVDLHSSAPGLTVTVSEDAEVAARGVQGLINCTPVGMDGYPGTPLPRGSMAGAEWAFDAVYTPRDTQFLADAKAERLTVVSGWELFFYQGVHAWKLFADLPLDEDRLRQDLQS